MRSNIFRTGHLDGDNLVLTAAACGGGGGEGEVEKMVFG